MRARCEDFIGRAAGASKAELHADPNQMRWQPRAFPAKANGDAISAYTVQWSRNASFAVVDGELTSDLPSFASRRSGGGGRHRHVRLQPLSRGVDELGERMSVPI